VFEESVVTSTPDNVAAAFLEEASHQLQASVKKIKHCLDQLNAEQIWWRPTPSQNSIANLILHVCGNVGQWIVSGVGEESDTRDRPAEFSARGGATKADLLERLDETVDKASRAIQVATSERLQAGLRIQGFETNGLAAIFHSVSHFQGHTQEIICLTRWQKGDDYQFECSPSSPKQGASN